MAPVSQKHAENKDASPALSFDGLRHDFVNADGQTTPVLDRLNMTIEPGKIVAIVSRSGAGKSTLFDIISGLLVPRSGRIVIGTVVEELSHSASPSQIRASGFPAPGSSWKLPASYRS